MRGVAQPRLQVRFAAGVGRKQVDRRVHADFTERLLHRRVLRPFELRLDGVDVDLGRLVLPDENEVVSLAFVGVAVAPDGAAGAAAEQRPAQCQVRLLGAALGGRHRDATPGVGDQHAGLGLLELDATGDRTHPVVGRPDEHHLSRDGRADRVEELGGVDILVHEPVGPAEKRPRDRA